jgi:RNA polymerase sigma-70 factor (ECF subfamily)
MNLSHKLSVDDLLEGCKRGERRTQELLYKLLSSRMLGVCMRYAKDQFEAEDMLQMGFVKVFQKVSEFREEGSFEGWIRRIMVNTAIETYRKNQRMIHAVDIDEVFDEPQVTFDMNGLEVKDLMKLIQELSAGYKLVFNLYAIEGYSHKEIAEQLGISEGASKSQLSRARAILKEKIRKIESNASILRESISGTGAAFSLMVAGVPLKN